jgi:trk system potassium uptake protein
MRIVFVGGGEITVGTARILIDRGYEVIIVEQDEERIEELSEILDCSFLHGDGSKPHILKEAGPSQTDVLLCLTDMDQINLITSLVGRSLGFQRVVTSIEDPEFEQICWELGLEDTIVPSRTISRYLADMVSGSRVMELSSVIKGEGRFFSFTAGKKNAHLVKELDLPKEAKVICLYRKQEFILTDKDTRLHPGDEVIILTHSKNLPDLQERWAPKLNNSEE